MAKPKIYQVDQLETMTGTMNTAITAAHNQANTAYGAANTGGGPKIATIVYPGNDSAANNIGGQTVYLTGTGFFANSSIYINGNSVPATSFISASNIGFTTPNLTNGIYPIYLINSDGATAIKIPGIVISGEPTWVTSAGSLNASQDEESVWSYSLSANGDTPITFALAAGSTLPTGVSLNANGVISGTISSPPGVETTYTFSVIATDVQNQDATRQFTVTTTAGEGVLFANNVLLIHADGTNNQNNHHFLDSSNNNFTITRNGNATQGTFSPFSQTGWSGYFDGTGDYLTAPANSAFAFSGDFTIEFWILTSTFNLDTYYRRVICFGQDAADNLQLLFRDSAAATTSNISVYTSSQLIDGSIAVADGSWHHIALCRSGSSMKLFVDGTQSGSTATTSQNFSAGSTNGMYIGRYALSGGHILGYMSNLRVLKGTALYTSTFTRPTAPFTAVANTSLLTLQSNRFIDNSNNAFTITRNGDVSVQAFAPFAPTAEYSTANVGGSGYFDGSGDWLSFGAQSAFDCGTSTDFCMEAWVYRIGSTIHIWSAHQAGVGDGFYFTTAGLNVYSGGGGGAGVTSLSKTIPAYAWSHVVITRQNDRLRYFLNGELIGTSTSSVQVNTDGRAVGINGGVNFTGDAGYIAGSRFIKGAVPIAYNTAVTTTNTQIFIPPSAPVTTTSQNANSSQVIALVNYTNAGIFDQTAKNILETVGDAKVSTAQYKYGTGSMYFDGNGDYLSLVDNGAFNMGTGNFTAEFWLYTTDQTNNYPGIISASVYNDTGAISVRYDNSGHAKKIFIYLAGASPSDPLVTSSVYEFGQWIHVAIVRDSTTTLKIYVNGTLDGTGTITSGQIVDFSGANSFYIGRGFNVDGAAGYLAGYVDDVRLTKGYARYTSNFTPPTSAFKNK